MVPGDCVIELHVIGPRRASIDYDGNSERLVAIVVLTEYALGGSAAGWPFMGPDPAEFLASFTLDTVCLH